MWLSECVINLFEVPYSLNIALCHLLTEQILHFPRIFFKFPNVNLIKMINYVISYREILLGVLVYKNLSKL